MNATEVRDRLVKGLYQHFGGRVPVYRSGQVSGEQTPPYVIYAVTGAGGRGGTMGHFAVCRKGDCAEEIRGEQRSMSLSFTACSQNREGEDGSRIFGEDEAQGIAEEAQGWFVHAGYDYLSRNNIVVSDVTEIQGRNVLMVDEELNRKGFDVICSYAAEDRRRISVVEKVSIKKKEDGNEGCSSVGEGG